MLFSWDLSTSTLQVQNLREHAIQQDCTNYKKENILDGRFSCQDRFLLSHLCDIITVDRPKEMELYVLSKTRAGNNKPELLLQAWANTAFPANTDRFFPFNLS